MPKYSNASNEGFSDSLHIKESVIYFLILACHHVVAVLHTLLYVLSQDAGICAQVAKKRHQNVFLSFGKESVTAMV